MDKRLLQYYNRELQYMREMAGEFAKEFPKIAGRLALDEFACADPYVERLLEGFAFLAARIHLKLDAEFPRLTQSILETVYPHYLAPTPSMAVVQFEPDLAQGSVLAAGLDVPRDTGLRSVVGKGDYTACEYRTAHPVTLWPIEIVEAEYHTRDLGSFQLPAAARAAIRIRLRTPPGLPFRQVGLDRLTFFLRGADDIPIRLHEQIFAHGSGLCLQPAVRPAPWQVLRPADDIRRAGYGDQEALLPYRGRSFQGYRLVHEFFAFPARYRFFELCGLQGAAKQCDAEMLDLFILLRQADLELENRVAAPGFALFCTPALNLFQKRLDRIHLSDRASEFHVVPDRTRPMDYEVYQVTGVVGHGVRSDEERAFLPFYAAAGTGGPEAAGAYFSINRLPRATSAHEERYGRRSSYAGSEVYLSLVDAAAAPYRSDLRQLSVTALCTNRDLPLRMPLGQGATDFVLDTNAPVASVRCVAGPTPPRPSYAEGEIAWRAISHLSLNYLSLVQQGDQEGASALREMLSLYCDPGDAQIRRQIDGVKSVSSRPIVRRLAASGPIAFVRGIEVILTLEEKAFEGSGAFLLGSVLEHFFAKYVSINSFSETVIKTTERGEIMRWPARSGTRQII
ncbi:MAG: type VI secretion system protein ImpG [Verrucomicrobia bacterium A1]|nr:MAG: type VI secretion system protein ImpG [Verrucomicrobia bacterium A1]